MIDFLFLAEADGANQLTAWFQQYLYPFLISLGSNGLFMAIFTAFVNGSTKRLMAKINVQKIAEDTTDKVIDKLKATKLEFDVKPIIMSEVKKMEESITEKYEKQMAEIEENQVALLLVLQSFMRYFDDSRVSEDVKNEARMLMAEALEKAVKPCTSIQATVVIEEEDKKTKKGKEVKIAR